MYCIFCIVTWASTFATLSATSESDQIETATEDPGYNDSDLVLYDFAVKEYAAIGKPNMEQYER